MTDIDMNAIAAEAKKIDFEAAVATFTKYESWAKLAITHGINTEEAARAVAKLAWPDKPKASGVGLSTDSRVGKFARTCVYAKQFEAIKSLANLAMVAVIDGGKTTTGQDVFNVVTALMAANAGKMPSITTVVAAMTKSAGKKALLRKDIDAAWKRLLKKIDEAGFSVGGLLDHDGTQLLSLKSKS